MFFFRLLMLGAVCVTAACSNSESESPASTANAAPSASESVPPGSPATPPSRAPSLSDSSAPPNGACALLTIAEIQQAFPDAKPGEPDGARSCAWTHRGGHVSIVFTSSSSRSLKDEASSFAADSLDPFQRHAASNLRFESVRGVGDEAIAVVEAADVGKGIVDGTAMVIVRRRSRQVTLVAPDLVNRDRADALRALGQLGAALAARME